MKYTYLVAAAQSPVDTVDNDGNGGDVTITRRTINNSVRLTNTSVH